MAEAEPAEGEGEGWSFEALDEAARRMEADEAEQRAYEARCHARQQAEDAWVDEVVDAQAAIAAAKAAAKAAAGEVRPAREGGAEESASRFSASLEVHGLCLTAEGAPQGGGRGVAARRPFAAGQVLLRAAPAAAVLREGAAATRCHHCFRGAAALRVCGGCRFARYCGGAHQRLAWRSHRRECAMLQKTARRVPGASVRLLARLMQLGREAAAEEGGGGAWAQSAAAVWALRSQLGEQPEERRRAFEEQAAMLCALLHELEPDSPPPSPRLGAELLSIISLNAHTIFDDELQDIGIGLYPIAALTNHSCAPSAVHTFDGDEIVLRSLSNLPAGSLVHIPYIELAECTPSRRAFLEETYLFTCCCTRCSQAETADTVATVKQAAADLRRSRELELAAIDSGNWEKLYPVGAPALGLAKVRLGKLCAHAEQLEEAVRHWRAGLSILSISHGDASELVEQTARSLREVELELSVAHRAGGDE